MSDPKHIKDQVKKLLESDQRYQAIRLIQNTYNVSEGEAEKLLSTLDKDDEPTQNTPQPPAQSGCMGCFSGLFKIGSILFGLTGILLLGILAVVYYYAEDFKKESIPVRGIVADTVHLPRTSTDTIQNVYLVFNYEAKDSLRSFQTTTSYPETLYQVQDSVDLRVNPNDADYATIDDESFFDDVFLVFGIAAGVMFFFALVLWIIGRAANNKPAT